MTTYHRSGKEKKTNLGALFRKWVVEILGREWRWALVVENKESSYRQRKKERGREGSVEEQDDE